MPPSNSNGGAKMKYMYGHGSVHSPRTGAFNSFANDGGPKQPKFLSPNKSPDKVGKMSSIGGQGPSNPNESLNLKGLV